MGFTPAEIDKMSLWQFMACVDGIATHNGGKKTGGGAAAEIDDSDLADMGIKGF